MESMEKKVYIIHGLDEGPDQGWIPWVKDELEKRGLSVHAPVMPSSEAPTVDEWLAFLNAFVERCDKGVFFVGHDIGCHAILHYLASHAKCRCGGITLVAPWVDRSMPESSQLQDVVREWSARQPSLHAAREIACARTAVFSSNDPVVSLLQNRTVFERDLAARIIVENGKGNLREQDGVLQLPSVRDAVLSQMAEPRPLRSFI
jgi:predicted alpha/beta hydrolase family esterase